MELFDLHCDTITLCKEKNLQLRQNALHINLVKLRQRDRWCQAFAIFIPDEYRGQQAKQYFEDCLAYYQKETLRNSDCIVQVRTFAEIEAAFARHRFASLLTVEGGAVLGGDLAMLDRLFDCGVRMMTLTWNGENELGSGSDTQKGLTEFGRQAIARMEQLGIIVDVSHLNDQGFEDLCNIATKPFIATHSNSRSICNHPRNLTDAQFCAIRDRGGLVGMNYYRFFITESGETESISDLVAHIQHFLKLGGENTVCLGSDFDGADIPEYLNGLNKVRNLKTALLDSGISEEVTDKILFGNAKSFFEKYLTK